MKPCWPVPSGLLTIPTQRGDLSPGVRTTNKLTRQSSKRSCGPAGVPWPRHGSNVVALSCRQSARSPSATFDARFGSIVHVEPLITDELTLPFAGRKMELAWLAARFSDVIAKPRKFHAACGEAGIGKSALLGRASSLAKQYGIDVFAVACSGEPTGSFEPWRKLFRVASGLGESLDAFVKMHPGDVSTAVANSIAARFTKPSRLDCGRRARVAGRGARCLRRAISHDRPSTPLLPLRDRRGRSTSTRACRLYPWKSFRSMVWIETTCVRRSRNVRGPSKSKYSTLSTIEPAGHPLFFVGLLNSLVSGGALMRDGAHWLLAKPIDSRRRTAGHAQTFHRDTTSRTG